jgi:hypothetical protein
LLAERILNFLTDALDSRREIIPDLDVFECEQPGDYEVFNIFDREHLLDVRAVKRVKRVDQLSILDERREPQTQRVLNNKGVILCQLIFPEDQGNELEDLSLQVSKVNLVQDVSVQTRVVDDAGKGLELLHGLVLAVKFRGFVFDLGTLRIICLRFFLVVLSHILITE